MNPFVLYTIESAPEKSKPSLAAVAKRLGFLPNVYAHLAEAPAVLEGQLQLSAIFGRTTLSERQRHVLMLTASVENECTFCVAAHTWGATTGGLKQGSIAAIRGGAMPEDTEDAAMVSFVRAVIASKGAVSKPELYAFFASGFTREHALEVVLGVTFKILTNYANHMTHPELNAELATFAWHKVKSKG
jgi:AhpD family alkylhydroperoxidase